MVSHGAWAKPYWVGARPQAGHEYKFYVGRGTSVFGEAEAFENARKDAQESAIRENFGVETHIAQDDYSTLSEQEFLQRRSERSKLVQLHDFELVDQYIAESNNIEVWLLFRYKISSIAAEKKRLAVGNPATPGRWVAVGGIDAPYKTTVYFFTEPLGAEVFLDGKRWGVTPLTLHGVIAPGRHSVELDHPRHQNVVETIIVVSGQETQVAKSLRPAWGDLTIASEPPGASVKIDGRLMGVTPISLTRVPAFKPVHIDLTHPDCESVTQVVQVEKSQRRWVNVALSRKPSYAARMPSGGHQSGANTYQQLGRLEQHQDGWIVGFYVSANDATNGNIPASQGYYGIGFTFENSFSSIAGLRLTVGYDSSLGYTPATGDSSESYALTGTSYGIGLPFYLGESKSSWYLMPEIGLIQHTYESYDVDMFIDPIYEKLVSQSKTGITLGYQSLSDAYQLNLTYNLYQQPGGGHYGSLSVGLAMVGFVPD